MSDAKPGCSRVAHERLGFCCHCEDWTAAEELVAWRHLAITGSTPQWITDPAERRPGLWLTPDEQDQQSR